MALATLSIDLEARLANLQQGMDKAGRLAEQQSQQIAASFNGMKTAAAGVGAALAASLSAAGIVSFVRATIDGVDRLNDLADATGASIENLSALEDIAARTGTNMDTVGDSVVKLNKVLGEAGKPGTEAAAALKALGLNAAELKRLDPAEALRQVAVALGGFADDSNKARLVQELFGKSVQEVAPLLKNLADVGRLNATVTAEQAREAGKFNDQLAVMAKNATDAARQVAGPLTTAINRYFDQIDMTKKAGFAGVFDAMLSFNAPELSRLDNLNGRLAEITRRYADVKSLVDATTAAGKRAPAELENQLKSLERQERFLRLLQQDRGGGRGTVNPGDKPAAGLPDVIVRPGTKATKPQDEPAFVVKLDEATAAALKRLQDTDTQKIAALRTELQALIELRSEAGAGSIDEAILAVEEEINKLSPAARAAAEEMSRLNAILGQTPTAILGEVLVDVDLLNKAFADGRIGVELWAEAVRASAGKLPGELEKPLAEISEFAQQAARNIQDSLGDTILAGLDGSFKNIGKLWEDMLKRMLAQAAAAQLNRAVFGDSFEKTGQIGGAAGSLIDFLRGLGGGARAAGGPVYAGRPYLVGERGPEVVVPRGNGTVLPNGRGLGGGAGSTFNVNVQGDASENTVRLINGALAQFEARQLGRRGA